MIPTFCTLQVHVIIYRNKSFRCQYVARQISVKYKYLLWVTEAEKEAMGQILEKYPEQKTY